MGDEMEKLLSFVRSGSCDWLEDGRHLIGRLAENARKPSQRSTNHSLAICEGTNQRF